MSGIEPVPSGHRAAGLDMLAGGEGAASGSVDEQFDPWGVMRGGEAHVVRRPLVAERRGSNSGIVPPVLR